MKIKLLKLTARLTLWLCHRINKAVIYLDQDNSQWFLDYLDKLNRYSIE